MHTQYVVVKSSPEGWSRRAVDLDRHVSECRALVADIQVRQRVTAADQLVPPQQAGVGIAHVEYELAPDGDRQTGFRHEGGPAFHAARPYSWRRLIARHGPRAYTALPEVEEAS
jgi:hypothetical protein